jgi:hypothetical protein
MFQTVRTFGAIIQNVILEFDFGKVEGAFGNDKSM